MPRVHLINPSNVSFGVAVITPRWLFVLAAATGTEWGDPIIVTVSINSRASIPFLGSWDVPMSSDFTTRSEVTH